MPKNPPMIELSWRDENYGSVCAVAAFRNYAGTLDWSERTHQRFRGCLKRAAFDFHQGRCSYIATKGTREDRQRALCDELDRAGFRIRPSRPQAAILAKSENVLGTWHSVLTMEIIEEDSSLHHREWVDGSEYSGRGFDRTMEPELCRY